jgi:hypothetical protein
MVNSRRSNREPSMTEVGHFPALPRRNSNGRFTSESSRNSDDAAPTLRAISGREQVQQRSASLPHATGPCPVARCGLTWAGLAPADRASFAWRLLSFDHLVGALLEK